MRAKGGTIHSVAVFVVQNRSLVVRFDQHRARAGIVLGVVEGFVRAFKKLFHGLYLGRVAVEHGYARTNGNVQVVFISFRIADKGG